MTSVRRVESKVTGAQWQVHVKDLQRKVFDPLQLFDAVVVCNGLTEISNLLEKTNIFSTSVVKFMKHRLSSLFFGYQTSQRSQDSRHSRN